jgi:hypothetical protein
MSSFRSLWPKAGTIVAGDYTAELFDPTIAEDRDKLDSLVASGAVHTIHDSLNDQLEELIDGRAPSERLQDDILRQRVLAHLGDNPAEHYGMYVYYPWRKELLHILPRHEFIEVRTSRNRYQITPAEQKRLGRMRIGVLGLSVGASTALTLALEGIGGELRIADFDTLSLSNTNRLRTSISNIGVNKAVLCARELSEINPYLQITVFPAGLSEENIEEFLTGGDKLDLLIEECDDFFMKLFSRERARHHGIPVIMETNDRGMLDIERFDQEPDRPLLHGLLGDLDSNKLKGLSTKQKVPYLLRFGGSKDTVSPRALASLFEISHTTKSWPQLASAISLGAAIAADTARRLLLGEALPSGRFYVDLKKLIAPGTTASLPDWSFLEPTEISQAASAVALPLSPQTVSAGPIQPIEAEYMVAYGCLAPSGGNSQPWHFTLREGRLDCSIPPTYTWTSLEFEGRPLWVAMGAAVENITIAAHFIGLKAQVLPAVIEGPKEVCSIHFERVAPVQTPQLAAIPKRITNRSNADLEKPLSDMKLQALIDAASRSGARLRLVQSDDEKRKIANIIGAIDRVRLLHPDFHKDLTGELRWSRKHAHASRDGIGIDTLELGTAERVGASLMTNWPSMQVLRDLNMGQDFEKSAQNAKTHAFALLTMPGKGLMTYLAGGRAMEQVWLEATLQDIAFAPQSSCIFLWPRLEEGGDNLFSSTEKEVLRAARREFLEVFPQTEPATEILLFRLSEAPAPTARSLRHPVSQVLTIVDS